MLRYVSVLLVFLGDYIRLYLIVLLLSFEECEMKFLLLRLVVEEPVKLDFEEVLGVGG